MATDFGELLSAERMRKLWGEGRGPKTPDPAEAGAATPPRHRSRKKKRADASGTDGLDEDAEQTQGEQNEELLDDPPRDKEEPSEDELAASARRAETPPAIESSTHVLDRLQDALQLVLGPRAALLQIYLQPLRLALSQLEGGPPPPPHPLQYALENKDVPRLLYQLEDTIQGLQLMAARFGR